MGVHMSESKVRYEQLDRAMKLIVNALNKFT